MVIFIEFRTKEWRNKLQQLKWKEEGKEEDHLKYGKSRLKRV
jgi:hypothetical protein